MLLTMVLLIESIFDVVYVVNDMEAVKDISIEFMGKASYQVERSDEGSMTDEIETCLEPVIQAVYSGDPAAAKSWASKMIIADRVGFICNEELKKIVGGTGK